MLEHSHLWPAGALLLATLAFFGVALRPAAVGSTVVPPPGPLALVEPAAGTLDVLGPDGEVLGACPLEHTSVEVEIAGFVSRVRVKQTFSNPFDAPIEAVYTFPLSSGGAVDAMTIRVGDRTIRGDVRRREEARALYEDAKQQGRLAALLDEERPNVFTQSIANLMPGTSIEVELRYVESLDYADGRFEFSFPMVVGPRFIPGTSEGRQGTGWSPDTDEVPDASRLTPPVAPEGVRAGHDVSVSVDLVAGLPISHLESRLHEIDVEEVDETHRRIQLRNQSSIPNRDFVLQWSVAAEELSSGVLVHRPDEEEAGYVTFLLVPPERVAPAEVAPREIVFVIDRSGSQAGRPLAQAKAAILHSIEQLGRRDTFQVVSFSNRVEKLFERPRTVTASTKRAAKSYVEGLQANGGTMMADAVREVCAEPAPENRLRIVSFMTDGYVGNDHEVIDLVKKLRGRSRWFPFGTGNSTNRYLLDHMAREGGGEVEYVLLDANPEEAARTFYERIASPVLTDVRIDFEGLEVRDVAPHRFPDLWAHKPLVVHARYEKGGSGRVVLRGFRQGKPWSRALDVHLPARADANGPIASMWARARVDELLAQDLRGLRQGAFDETFEDSVVEIALAHHLLTPFTSFIAVQEEIVNEHGVLRTVTVPVEVPDGVDRGAVFGDVTGTLGVVRSLGAAPAALAFAPTAKGRVRSRGRPVAEETESAEPLVHYDSGAHEEMIEEILSGPEKLKVGRLLRAALERLAALDEELVVTIRLATPVSPAITAELESSGLRLDVVAGHEIVGTISVNDLPELLGLRVVGRVELA